MLASFIKTSPQLIVEHWNPIISAFVGERRKIESKAQATARYIRGVRYPSSALPSIQDKLIQTIFIAFISLAKDMRELLRIFHTASGNGNISHNNKNIRICLRKILSCLTFCLHCM